MSRKNLAPRGRTSRLPNPITSVLQDTTRPWSMLAYPEIQFTWVIKNFKRWVSYLKRRKVKVAYSPEFPSGPSTPKWRMVFKIHQTTNTALFLEPVGECPGSIKVKFYFILYADCQELVQGGYTLNFPSDEEFQGCKNLLFLHRMLPWVEMHGDSLTIACEVLPQLLLQKGPTSCSDDIEKFHMAYAKLNADMGKLLEMDQYGDVQLAVGTRTFSAYKGILAARSSVFADMFNKRSNNRFEIPDVEPELFEELLRYIYTDQVSELATLKFKLYRIAKRFNIESLKQLCQDAILAGLSLGTIVDALKTGLAYYVDEPEIMQRALAFIFKEKLELAHAPGWDELNQRYPCLARKAEGAARDGRLFGPRDQ